MSDTYDFKHINGDTWDGMVVTVQSNGSPVDLTDAAIRMQVRKGRDATPIVDVQVGSGIIIDDAVNGVFRISPVILSGSECGNYGYDVEITFPDGRVKTWLRGTIVLLKDYTYA